MVSSQVSPSLVHRLVVRGLLGFVFYDSHLSRDDTLSCCGFESLTFAKQMVTTGKTVYPVPCTAETVFVFLSLR